MRKFLDWLIRHERFLIGITLVLAVALIAQFKFGATNIERDVNLAGTKPPATLENPSNPTTNIAGSWEMSVKKKSGTQTWTLMLKQDGEQLTGVINSEGGDLPVTGTIKGQTINLSAKRLGVTVEFPAILNGEIMTGTMRVLTVNREWTARRAI